MVAFTRHLEESQQNRMFPCSNNTQVGGSRFLGQVNITWDPESFYHFTLLFSIWGFHFGAQGDCSSSPLHVYIPEMKGKTHSFLWKTTLRSYLHNFCWLYMGQIFITWLCSPTRMAGKCIYLSVQMPSKNIYSHGRRRESY